MADYVRERLVSFCWKADDVTELLEIIMSDSISKDKGVW